jgi:murein DD-endopeptidase MepM/ murein hydrolase activator NlpD
MKKGFKNHKFTLMFIPHNNSEVRSIKIPAILINGLAVFGLLSLVVVGVLFINSSRLETKLLENNELKSVNSIQNQEIKTLKEETTLALEKLEEIKKTDAKVREMVGLKSNEDTNITASRSDSGGTRYPSRSLINDNYDLLNSTYATNNENAEQFSEKNASGLTDIKEIKEMLKVINEEVGNQEKILTSLEKETSDRIRFLAAKPSGRPSSGRLTSPYGWRTNPFSGRGSEFHSGIDIASGYGTRIVATGSGKVTFSGYRAGFGYTVVINHGYGYTTMYAHCSSLNVKVGDQVKRGELIARMGRSGRATGPHVHYEVTYNGRTINPQTTM